jgi:hypothetical protein
MMKIEILLESLKLLFGSHASKGLVHSLDNSMAGVAERQVSFLKASDNRMNVVLKITIRGCLATQSLDKVS